jgi:hypothetical protein
VKLIICGGRDFHDAHLLADALRDWFDAHGRPEEIVTGGATGADALGKAWALAHGVPHREFPADWHAFGKRAGPLRNAAMRDHVMPDGGVLALPGGRGTRNMVELARAAGLTVVEVKA